MLIRSENGRRVSDMRGVLFLLGASVLTLALDATGCSPHALPESPPKERVMSQLSLPDLVRNLAERVAFARESPLDIARSFGTIESENSSWITAIPSDQRLKHVITTIRPDSSLLGNVELVLAVPGSITAAELAAFWGAPGIPPSLAITRTTLIFYPPAPPDAPFRAIVTIVTDGDETGPALSVQVIRDIK